MLKKFGFVAVGVTAGLMAAAPFASAQTFPPETESPSLSEIPSAPEFGEGNDGQFNEDNEFHQHNFEGNTFNGEEVDNPFADFDAGDLPSAEDGGNGFGGGFIGS